MDPDLSSLERDLSLVRLLRLSHVSSFCNRKSDGIRERSAGKKKEKRKRVREEEESEGRIYWGHYG